MKDEKAHFYCLTGPTTISSTCTLMMALDFHLHRLELIRLDDTFSKPAIDSQLD